MFKATLLVAVTLSLLALPAIAGDVGEKDEASCASVSDTVTPPTPEQVAEQKKVEDAKKAAEAK